MEAGNRPATPSAGDFEALFEAEHERLLRALFIVTGSAEEADELMQDAFVAVWERWDRVGSMNDPTGYLSGRLSLAVTRHSPIRAKVIRNRS